MMQAVRESRSAWCKEKRWDHDDDDHQSLPATAAAATARCSLLPPPPPPSPCSAFLPFPALLHPPPTGSMMISSHFLHPLFPDIIHFSPPIYDLLLARTFLFCYVWYHPSLTPIYNFVVLLSSVIPNIVHFSRRSIASLRAFVVRYFWMSSISHPRSYDLLARTFLFCYIQISSISQPDHL